MTLAIMQPYVFPYLGYYQLVEAVDCFVFFDDVHYINKGWINRNRILKQDEAFRFTVSLNKASQNKLISEITIVDFIRWRTDFLRLLELNYKRAPFFTFFYIWLKEFLFSKEYRTISNLAADSVKAVANLLGLSTQFIISSELAYKADHFQDGQDKILKICELLKADHYINPQNGMEIYAEDKFAAKNIELNFIKMNDIVYGQFEKEKFVPSLSIIDVLMFVDLAKARGLLKQYTLVKK
jgi:hypothetical protein